MEMKLYDEDDLRDTKYRSGTEPWEFIADLPGDNPDLFEDLDNHSMVERLREFGAVGADDVTDPEACCTYIYFKKKADGLRFIKKLNKYIIEKATLVEKAQNF